MYSKDTKLVTSCFSTLQHLLYIEHFHSSINAATKDYENNLKKKRNNQQQFCVRRVFFILITKYMCILMLYNKRVGHTKNTIKRPAALLSLVFKMGKLFFCLQTNVGLNVI